MKQAKTWLSCALCTVLLAAWLPAHPGQDPEREERPRLRPELTPRAGDGPQLTDPQRELFELFRKVERRLREIDVLLVDAGSGDTRRLAQVGAAGIDDLIQSSLERGRENLRDIDRIIEIAQEQGSRPANPMPGDCEGDAPGEAGAPSQGQDPGSTARESTPEAPDPGDGEAGSEEDGAGEEPNGEQAEDSSAQESGRPEDGGPSESPDPINRPGEDPPRGETDRPGLRPNDAERWGDLPVKVRDVFRHEGSDDLPPQYRDWIDAYHRRLQRGVRRR